jgi:hypothetical protein
MVHFGNHANRARRERIESERLSSKKSSSLAHDKRRARKRAESAQRRSDKINYQAMQTILKATPQNTKLSKKDSATLNRLRKKAEIPLREMKPGRSFSSEDVVKAFRILQKVAPEESQKLSNTYKFRILK